MCYIVTVSPTDACRAVVKAKNRNTDDHDLFKDMKALVRHNVGG